MRTCFTPHRVAISGLTLRHSTAGRRHYNAKMFFRYGLRNQINDEDNNKYEVIRVRVFAQNATWYPKLSDGYSRRNNFG